MKKVEARSGSRDPFFFFFGVALGCLLILGIIGSWQITAAPMTGAAGWQRGDIISIDARGLDADDIVYIALHEFAHYHHDEEKVVLEVGDELFTTVTGRNYTGCEGCISDTPSFGGR